MSETTYKMIQLNKLRIINVITLSSYIGRFGKCVLKIE